MRKNAKLIENHRRRIKREAKVDIGKQVRLRDYQVAVRPVLEELSREGYRLDTLEDLRHGGKPWKTAIPVLVRWLPKVDDLRVKESIVRCLSVPWLDKQATARLIEEFEKSAPILPSPSNPWTGSRLSAISESEKGRGAAFSLAWAAGNALSIVDLNGFERKVIELCRNPKYGMARQMLVTGLGRLRSPEAEEAAIDLLGDDQVRLHAIGALASMKSRRALFELERLLADKRPSVRNEARKAIIKIMR